MKRYFVVTDVHSFFDEMQRALETAGYDPANPDHVFVSLGDLFDRGPKPVECLAFVNAIPKERKILIRGNHEDLLEDCLLREKFNLHDFSNGTEGTVLALSGLSSTEFHQGDCHANMAALRENKALRAYFDALVDYAEVGNYVLVHGWIPKPLGEDGDWRDGFWHEARWLNGMQEWYAGRRVAGKTVLCGHFNASWGHAYIENRGSEYGANADFSPFRAEGIVAMDACTAYSHRMNCVVFDA